MSLLERTNQLWKLYVFGVLMVLGAVLTLCQRLLAERFGREYIDLIVYGGMAMVAGGLVFGCTFISCPNCKLKLFWHAVTKEGLGSWFVWLINEEQCPQCGSRDGLPQAENTGVTSRKRKV